jgi:uncharacterized membrane protein
MVAVVVVVGFCTVVIVCASTSTCAPEWRQNSASRMAKIVVIIIIIIIIICARRSWAVVLPFFVLEVKHRALVVKSTSGQHHRERERLGDGVMMHILDFTGHVLVDGELTG